MNLNRHRGFKVFKVSSESYHTVQIIEPFQLFIFRKIKTYVNKRSADVKVDLRARKIHRAKKRSGLGYTAHVTAPKLVLKQLIIYYGA